MFEIPELDQRLIDLVQILIVEVESGEEAPLFDFIVENPEYEEFIEYRLCELQTEQDDEMKLIRQHDEFFGEIPSLDELHQITQRWERVRRIYVQCRDWRMS